MSNKLYNLSIFDCRTGEQEPLEEKRDWESNDCFVDMWEMHE